MQLNANVTINKDVFLAELSDGRQFRERELKEIACELSLAGVVAKGVTGDWRPGCRILTAGQQLALKAEMRRFENVAQQAPLAA